MKAKEIRNQIESINKKNFWGMQSFKMGTALGVSLAYEVSVLKTWRDSLISLYLSFFYCFAVKRTGDGKLMFLFPSNNMGATWHSQGCLDMAKLVKNGTLATINIYKSNALRKENIINILYSPLWFLQMLKEPLTLKQKLYLVGKLGICKKWATRFSQEIESCSPALVTTYCDSHMYDNIAAQCCRIKNIPTATFQHGMYAASTDTTFSDGFELFVSDIFLAWGEYTKACAIGGSISPERIYITGSAKAIKKIHMVPDTPVFGVMLSGYCFGHEQGINSQLIKLANELAQSLGLKYIIKPHFSDKVSSWEHLYNQDLVEYICENNESIEYLASSMRFFLCPSTSTVAFDFINIGAITFVHHNEYENHHSFCFGKLSFKTIDDLIYLTKWSDEFREDYLKESDAVDQYAFAADSNSSYMKFFERYYN